MPLSSCRRRGICGNAKRAEGVSIPSFLGFCAIQLVGTLDGHYQHDNGLLVGMAMSLLTCGVATGLAIYYAALNRAPQGYDSHVDRLGGSRPVHRAPSPRE